MSYDLIQQRGETSWFLFQVKRHYAAGRYQRAHELAARLKRRATALKPNDFILLSAVSRAAGEFRRSYAWLRLACRLHPGHPEVLLAWARVTRKRNSVLRAQALLEGFDAPPRYAAAKYALLADCSATLGFVHNANKQIEQSIALGADKSAFALHHLAMAWGNLREWDKAVQFARRGLKSRPNSVIAVLALVDLLLSRGDSAEAHEILQSAASDNADIAVFRCYTTFAMGRAGEAARILEQAMQLWPAIAADKGLGRLLFLLRWFSGQRELALANRPVFSAELNARLDSRLTATKQVLLPTPLIAQQYLMCVPTSVAMMTGILGQVTDPVRLFEQMYGYSGTELWRVREVMTQYGYDTHCLRFDIEVITQLLDQGLPVMVQSQGMFNAHVEVVCGYDEALNILVIRDPMEWMPYHMEMDAATGHFQSAGSYVLVLTPATGGTSLPEGWKSATAELVLDLARACARGETAWAQTCFEQIPDTADEALEKFDIAYGITVSAHRYREAVKQIATDPRQHQTIQLKALLRSQDAELITQRIAADDSQLNPHIKGYLRVTLCLNRKDYAGALTELEPLLRDYPNFDQLHVSRAIALLELGHLEEAEAAAANAVELSSRSIAISQQVRAWFPHRNPYRERLAEVQGLIERNPSVHGLQSDLAQVMADGDDGIAYEHQLLRCMALQPKLPTAYAQLARFYAQQQRPDLVARVRERAVADLDQEDAEWLASNLENVPDAGYLWSAVDAANGWDEFAAAVTEVAAAEGRAWHDDIRLLVARIRLAAHAAVTGEGGAPSIPDMLPAALPGVLPYSLRYFLDLLRLDELDRKARESILSWATALVAGADWHEDVEFNLAFLQETLGELKGAEARLRKIIHLRPGYGAAHYRLGQILETRGALREAIEAYHRALEITPNRQGCLDRLVVLYRYERERENMVRAARGRYQLSPYDYRAVSDYVSTLVAAGEADEATALVDQNHPGFSPAQCALLRAQIALDAGRLAEVEPLVSGLLDGDEADAARRFLLTSLAERNAWEQLRDAADEALAVSADDREFTLRRMQALENLDAAGARDAYRKLLAKYPGDEYIIRRLFESADPEASLLETAHQMMRDAPQAEQAELGITIASVLAQLGRYGIRHEFIEHWVSELPHAPGLKAELCDIWIMLDRHDDAITLATQLHAEDPAQSNWVLLLARALQIKYPERAVEVLKNEYERSGSLDALVFLAMTYHNLGAAAQAKMYYRQVLKRDTSNVLALSNMVQLGESPGNFVDGFREAMDKGLGGNMQYFHINAVRVVKDAAARLPVSWLAGATERFERALAEKPFRDEIPRLARYIAIWLRAEGRRDLASEYLSRAKPFTRLRDRLRWEFASWLPARRNDQWSPDEVHPAWVRMVLRGWIIIGPAVRVIVFGVFVFGIAHFIWPDDFVGTPTPLEPERVNDCTVAPADGDEGLRLAWRVSPRYPAAMQRNGIEGYVDIEFQVTPSGMVQDVVVVDGSPPGAFDASVLESAARLQYCPTGKPGLVKRNMRIRFQLE
ncbi:MAG: TonB family protein [Gammaproteobacteria bacterium]|nr:TonB family protein [Gammaproteobacteria bacterium]